MRLIDADTMAVDESAAYISAQIKVKDEITRRVNTVVHMKIQQLIADTPTVDAVEVVHCGLCRHADNEDSTGWLWCNKWQAASNCGGYCFKGERRSDDG